MPALPSLEVGPGTALTSLARLNLGADGARRVVASMRRARPTRRDDDEALLEAAGRLWLAGATLDWPAVHAEARAAACRCRPIRSSASATGSSRAAPRRRAGAPARGAALGERRRLVLRAHLDAATTAPAAAASPARWLVLGDAGALARRRVRRSARTRRRAVAAVERGAAFAPLADAAVRACRHDRPTTWRGAYGTADRRDVPARCVHLWSLPATARRWPPKRRMTRWSRWRPRSAGTGAAARIVHATAGAESVLDEAGARSPGRAGAGPVLVLPTELPGLQMRRVDLDSIRGGVDVTAGGGSAGRRGRRSAAIEPQVARRAGRRWVRRYERLRAARRRAAPSPLAPEGAYLITGGLGGMGLALARWLGETHRRAPAAHRPHAAAAARQLGRLAAVASADERHAAAITAIREIEAAGGEVLVAAADAADEAAMARVLSPQRSSASAPSTA